MNEPQVNIEGYFPTILQFSKNPNAEKMKLELLGELRTIQTTVENSAPKHVDAPHYSTLWSGINLLERKSFRPLRDFIFQEAVRFADFNKLDIQKFPLKLNESWVNIHSTGNYQEPHVHMNSVISGVYYIKAPIKSGDFIIHSPYKYTMLSPPTTEYLPLTQSVSAIQPEEGLAIMFRSYVEHSVRSNKSNDERISISYNFTM